MNPITINYQNVTLTSSSAQISVSQGSFGLETSGGLSISGTAGFDALYVTSSVVNFASQSGAMFNAAVSVMVAANSGSDPVITATNFSGNVTVSWPTSNGPQIQMLSPGNPITLSGFVD